MFQTIKVVQKNVKQTFYAQYTVSISLIVSETIKIDFYFAIR
jgi:hypothetical protein